MGHIHSGASLEKATIDVDYSSLRTTQYPPTVVGSFSVSATSTNAIAAATAANTVLATFKNGNTNYIVIKEIKLSLQTTVAYTKGGTRLGFYFVRNSFTQGTTGGTVVTMTGDKKTTMAATTATMVIYNTAGITGDTATGEDTIPMASILFDLQNAVSTQPSDGSSTLFHYGSSEFPVVLAPNEGFRIKNDVAFAAAGTSFLTVEIDYDEYENF